MKASELARATAMSVHTIRYYERIGLLKASRNKLNGYHEFFAAHVAILNFIRRAQSVGLSLGEIRVIFERSVQRRSPCPEVRDMVRRRLPKVEQEVAELTALRERMRRALGRWRRMRDGIPTGTEVCRLIESLGERDLT